MSYKFGPKIVTDGLVLYMDAGNTRSYPGSGTVWGDLAVGTNNITLNSTTFNPSNNGNLVFDGTNSYADFFCPNLTNTATIEFFANVSVNPSSFGMVLGWNTYDIYFYQNKFGFNTANGDVYGISSSTVTSLGLINNWVHYVCVMRTDVSYTNNKIYINGNQQSLSSVNGNTEGAKSFNSGNGRISGWRFDTLYKLPMNLSFLKIYNRELSLTEVLQNYNATKSRFGLI